MTLLAAARLCGEASPIAASVNYYPIASLEPALGAAWQDAQQLPEDPSSADWAAMSPLTHVAAGFPPTLLMHGSADTMVALDQSLRLHEALTQPASPRTSPSSPTSGTASTCSAPSRSTRSRSPASSFRATRR